VSFTFLFAIEFLNLAGIYVPEEQFVQVFERYFESRIVPQHNEMEVLSFVTACRIMADGVFQGISQIMENEMTIKESDLVLINAFSSSNQRHFRTRMSSDLTGKQISCFRC
jgi:hypothetical protein